MSLKTTLTRGVFAAILLASGVAFAQTSNPMDVVPEQIPNDIPYPMVRPYRSIAPMPFLPQPWPSRKKRDWKLICAVYDSGGNMVSFKRMEGAQIASIAIAEHTRPRPR